MSYTALYPLQCLKKKKNRASLVAQTVKNLPAMWDALEKEIATRSSILAWKIPGTEETGGLRLMGWQRVGHD